MARRRRRLEQTRSMGVTSGGLLELAQVIDQYVTFFVRAVRLCSDAQDQGLVDDGVAETARALSVKMMAQIPTFASHVAKWQTEALTPESRREVARIARQLERCRMLGQSLLDLPTQTGRPQPGLRRRGRNAQNDDSP